MHLKHPLALRNSLVLPPVHEHRLILSIELVKLSLASPMTVDTGLTSKLRVELAIEEKRNVDRSQTRADEVGLVAKVADGEPLQVCLLCSNNTHDDGRRCKGE